MNHHQDYIWISNPFVLTAIPIHTFVDFSAENLQQKINPFATEFLFAKSRWLRRRMKLNHKRGEGKIIADLSSRKNLNHHFWTFSSKQCYPLSRKLLLHRARFISSHLKLSHLLLTWQNKSCRRQRNIFIIFNSLVLEGSRLLSFKWLTFTGGQINIQDCVSTAFWRPFQKRSFLGEMVVVHSDHFERFTFFESCKSLNFLFVLEILWNVTFIQQIL